MNAEPKTTLNILNFTFLIRKMTTADRAKEPMNVFESVKYPAIRKINKRKNNFTAIFLLFFSVNSPKASYVIKRYIKKPAICAFSNIPLHQSPFEKPFE